ncbi:hypothetical protein Taro_014492 [Colocasia esculenta]|uniref:Uncharacterized protein n=1 Tax=Colocasia esculenta TaxID=4460 RepID=A0A843UF15_COLES|nr:hypothetical protein [Colocasia esculenta]
MDRVIEDCTRGIDPRDFIDMETTSTEDAININMQDGAGFDVQEGNGDLISEANEIVDFDDLSLVRTDVDGEIVDTLLPNVMQVVGATNDRSTRGPTHCKDIWTLNEQEKIPIKTNEYGQPINEHTFMLSNFLGTVIRRHGLLNGTDWRLVDETIKDDMWADVKSRFEFDGDCKDWVLRSIAKKRRAWKTRIKANYFNPFESDEERLRACKDNRIDSDKLKEALQFWNSEKGHRKKMPNGEDPSRAHIFMVTHTRKNGNPVDEESARVIDSNSTDNILDIGSPHEHSFSRASNIDQNHEEITYKTDVPLQATVDAWCSR